MEEKNRTITNCTAYTKELVFEAARLARFEEMSETIITNLVTIGIGIIIITAFCLPLGEELTTVSAVGAVLIGYGIAKILVYFVSGGLRARELADRITSGMGRVSDYTGCEITAVIDDEEIRYPLILPFASFKHKDIKGLKASENAVLLSYKDGTRLVLDRNGFGGDSFGDFLERAGWAIGDKGKPKRLRAAELD